MRSWAKHTRLVGPHRSSPTHTTTITSTGRHLQQHPAPGGVHARAQPRRRPSLPIVSRVYPQLLPHHYYHHNRQQRAPTPAVVGSTPAAARGIMTVTGSPAGGASTSAAPGSTQDGPSPAAANHAARPAPGAPDPSGAAAGHAADHGENAGEREAAGGGAGEAAAAAAAAGVVDGEGGGSGGGDVKTLPAPTEGGNVQTLEVDGKPISLDHMGPMVVHKDGTLSRINNWGEMTEIERQNTLRILVKRNQVRLGALRQGLQTEDNETK
ncbi:hypothetical protein J7T55_006409 [Diaporthe amygdali]|uniref:uncharacterized protein n=1 Tax=Phomopsis amygdali TaxID=1214568 RepID=UPI0022FEDEB3|nr:uncharacterized protein J7T55_006409 [Diaporthe amygdali]KAJ0125065.1 hypothetical protein J7T55_006409 [Diaporthe amygdali]